MSAIQDLVDAALNLEKARLGYDEALLRLGTVDHRDRHALGTIGSDIVETCLFLIPASVSQQLRAWNGEIADLIEGTGMTQAQTERQDERIPAEAARGRRASFALSMKLAYFLIRSFQDAVYRAAFQSVEERKAPKGLSASMSGVLKEEDPIRLMLGAFFDSYGPWFQGWKGIRDQIKFGRPSGTLGSFEPGAPQDDIGINLNNVTQDGGIVMDARGTRVSDITKAVQMSIRLLELATQAAAPR